MICFLLHSWNIFIDKFKEENWNLEVVLQELRSQHSDAQAAAQCLETEHKRLTKALANARDHADHHKNDGDRLQSTLEELKNKHETDISQARKHAAGLLRNKSDLQQIIDALKAENACVGRGLPGFGSPLTPDAKDGADLTPAGHNDHNSDVFGANGGASTNRRKLDVSDMFAAKDLSSDFAHSPEPSPIQKPFLEANHPSNEIEALQQRMAHAQRQIATLKVSLNREKQLRRRLEGADFLTPTGHNDHDSDDFGASGGASINHRRMDVSDMFAADLGSECADSPGASPVQKPFLAANHPSNEIEALQQRLAHAQRQINALKGSLSREKQHRTRLEGGAGDGMVIHDDEDEEYVDKETVSVEGKKSTKKLTPFKVEATRGRGRGRGRGITSLMQKPGMAAQSPASEYNDDDEPNFDDAPPVPSIPIHFSRPEDEEDDEVSQFVGSSSEGLGRQDEIEHKERRISPSSSPLDSTTSNQSSVDGMDPAFVNVLRRVPSNGSYAGSPLRQSVLGPSARGGAVPRRLRGGVPFKETLIVAKSETSIQHDAPQPVVLAPPVLVDNGVGTDPVLKRILVQAEAQSKDIQLTMSPDSGRRATITQADFSHANTNVGDSMITNSFLVQQHDEEEIDEGEETETGADTEDDYHDAQTATQSIETEHKRLTKALALVRDHAGYYKTESENSKAYSRNWRTGMKVCRFESKRRIMSFFGTSSWIRLLASVNYKSWKIRTWPIYLTTKAHAVHKNKQSKFHLILIDWACHFQDQAPASSHFQVWFTAGVDTHCLNTVVYPTCIHVS